MIINGFDRCGSSMIGGLLAKHPQISYLFHPFSSTEIHKTQYEIWPSEHSAPETERFIKGLLDGYVDQRYIASDWFHKHSTSFNVHAGKLNVIKDTKLHFKIGWLKKHFPEISFYGIWRDPCAIVCSLMRNDFYSKWYGESAFNAISKVIGQEPLLKPYRKFLSEPLYDAEKMALIVVARTHYIAAYLSPDEWIVYEDVLNNPNCALNPVIKQFNLGHFDFSKYLDEDFNVIGKTFEKIDLWQEYFPYDQIKRLDKIFSSLITLVKGNGLKMQRQ